MTDGQFDTLQKILGLQLGTTIGVFMAPLVIIAQNGTKK